jgi:CheY-like chemotaxis protein
MRKLTARVTPPQIVLVVEPDPEVRDLLVRSLEFHGCWAFTALCGVEALNVFPTYAHTIEAALIDQHLPGMDALATMRALQRIKPGLRCCILGSTVSLYRDYFLAAGAAAILPKPFRQKMLGECIRDLHEDAVPCGW